MAAPGGPLLVHVRSTLLALDYFDPSELRSGVGAWRGEVLLELLIQHPPAEDAALLALLPARLLNFSGPPPRTWLVRHGPSAIPAGASASPAFRPTRVTRAASLLLHACGTFEQALDVGAYPLDSHLLRAELALDVPAAQARFASEAENVWAAPLRHALAMPPSRRAALAHFSLLAAPTAAVFRTPAALSPGQAQCSLLCLAYTATRRASAPALAQALAPNFVLGCAGLLARSLGSGGDDAHAAALAAQHTLLVLLLAVVLWGARSSAAGLHRATLSEAYTAATLGCLLAHFVAAALAAAGVLDRVWDNISLALLAEAWAVANVAALTVYARFVAAQGELGPAYAPPEAAAAAAAAAEAAEAAAAEQAEAEEAAAAAAAGGGGGVAGKGEAAGALGEGHSGNGAARVLFGAAAGAEELEEGEAEEEEEPAAPCAGDEGGAPGGSLRAALAAFQRGDFQGFLEVERGESGLRVLPGAAAAAAAAAVAAAAGSRASPRRGGGSGSGGSPSAPPLPSPAEPEEIDNDPRIVDAARANDAGALAALLAHGGSADSRCARGATALMRAARAGHEGIVSALLSAGASVDKRRRRGCGSTALLLAVKARQAGVARALLGAGADAGAARSDGGCSPLMWASWKGWGEMLALLLSEGGAGAVGSVNAAREMDGTTALMMAARQGHVECVRLLLGVPGVRAGQRNHLGFAALDLAKDEQVQGVLREALARERAAAAARAGDCGGAGSGEGGAPAAAAGALGSPLPASRA